MFSFNGGPGSSSVWLHLGALGPKRVKMRADGAMPSPPYRLVDNDHTWLEHTDLVFIDPVGTGYSRPAKPELGKKFWGLKGDIESVGEFIRLYLTRYERWASPLFLVGRELRHHPRRGARRSPGRPGHRVQRHRAGVVDPELPDRALHCAATTCPTPLFLPTYAATAWFHKKLPADLQARPLRRRPRRGRGAGRAREYPTALQKGDRHRAPPSAQAAVKRLARYTGLEPEYVDETDLRIEIQRFCKELLRDERRTVGRLDSRFRAST